MRRPIECSVLRQNVEMYQAEKILCCLFKGRNCLGLVLSTSGSGSAARVVSWKLKIV